MKQYQNPEITLVLLQSTDVITASDGMTLGEEWNAATSGLKFGSTDFWTGEMES